MFARGYALRRWEGVMFLAFYAAYLTWLVLDSTDHAIRDEYAVGILGFMLPLSVVTLVVIWFRGRGEPDLLAS
jgi:cation:H+ antiporter